MKKVLAFLFILSMMVTLHPLHASEISDRELLTLEGTYEFSVTVTNPDNANVALKHDYDYKDTLPADLIQHTFRVDVKSVDGEFLLYHKGEELDNSGLGTDKKHFFFSFYYQVTTSSMKNLGYEIQAEVNFDEAMGSFDTLVPKKASLVVFVPKGGGTSYGYVGNGSLEMNKVGDKPEEEEPEEEAEERKAQLPRALTFVRGRVSIKRVGTEEWIWARKGMSLNAGDTIRTGEKSYADIGMNATEFSITGSEIRMAPLSVITIPDDTLVVERKSRLRVTIDEGVKNVYALFNKEEFTVETPSAVMGIRGTDFIIEVDEDGNTRVLMNDGTVEVRSHHDDSTRTIFAGEKVQANLGEKIGNKEQLTEADQQAFAEYEFENLPPEGETEPDATDDPNQKEQKAVTEKKPITTTLIVVILVLFLIITAVLVIRRKQ